MSLNIYFHIDEFARDAIVASVLKKELNSRGHKLTYGNRLSTIRLLEKFIYSFDVIIIPRSEFMSRFKSLNGNSKFPPIVILFTESVGGVVDLKDDKLLLYHVLGREFMEGDCPYYQKVSAFLLWGNTVLDRIKKYYPNVVDKCTVVGHPRHDERCASFTLLKTESEKIRVGFITRQDLLNTFDGRQVMQWIVSSALEPSRYLYKNKKTGDFFGDPRNNLVDSIYIQSSDINVLIKTIKRLDPNKYEVYLRVHPRENRNQWVELVEKYKINVRFTDWHAPFAGWAKSMDYVVGPASTCFYDCCMLGVKPISIQNINPMCHQHLKGSYAEEFNALSKHIDKPGSIDDLLELIKTKCDSFVPSDEIKKILAFETNYPNCKSSINKIVDKCVASAKINDVSKLVKCVNFVLFRICSGFMTYASHVVRGLRGTKEQSSTFLLTRKNKKFIDNLTEG